MPRRPQEIGAIALLCGGLLCGAAGADDRVQFVGECHPPVMPTIDPDWRREARDLREETLRAFTRALLDREAARRQLGVVLQLAAMTRIGAVDVIQLTRELLLRGVRGRELATLRGAAMDVQASQGADVAARFLRLLFSLRGRALVVEDDLKDADEIFGRAQVRDAVGRKVGAEKVERRLREGLEPLAATAIVLDALLRGAHPERAAEPGDVARAALSSCVVAMSRTCTRRQAEEHCMSTPREYLDALRGDL